MILVLSPHTDDAEIGCGGSLMKWKEEGEKIEVIAFSRCEESIPSGFDKDATEKEFMKNMDFIGAKRKIVELPVRRFPDYRQEILQCLKNQETPDLVVCPSLDDIHQDHRVVAEEAVRAFRERSSIISYDLPYSTMNFNANMYIKLEERHIKNKHIMINNYKSQVGKFPEYFAKEYIYGNAQAHGMKIKTNYAEIFEVVRWLL
jgi:LmbE family N-acetylglucosaminyl deacetylase